MKSKFLTFLTAMLDLFGWGIVIISFLNPDYDQSIFGVLLLIYSKIIEIHQKQK